VTLAAAAVIAFALAGLAGAQDRQPPERVEGGIVRGPRHEKLIALEFTGHEFAEGATIILDTLEKRRALASFFFTGDFLREPRHASLIARARNAGHYLGPHSDKHLLYCDWTAERRTLLSREAFGRDVENNLRELERYGVARATMRHWVPAYEHYNLEISGWSSEMGLRLVNYTRGTRSNADYTGEADGNFVPSDEIVRSILARESAGPDGLNGFLLLLHVGAGPGRRDKMHDRFPELMDRLIERGYTFVRVDTLLEQRSGPRPPPKPCRPSCPSFGPCAAPLVSASGD